MDNSYHQSVLLNEVLDYLQVGKGGWYLDATLGDGGHSLEIIKHGGMVLGLDVDPEAIERTKDRFQTAGINPDNYQIIKGNFRDVDLLSDQNRKFSGAVFDLGVSTLQLKNAKRGFSLYLESQLDMRMDPELKVKALDLINGLNKGELELLFKKYGEERYAKKIADAVVSSRPVETTTVLAQLIEDTVGGKKSYIHPATQTFQALRIAVNDELFALQEGLSKILDLLLPGSRICVISFHSLEDGIVKRTMLGWEALGLGTIMVKKPINPNEAELAQNIRSRSAKLRVFEKS